MPRPRKVRPNWNELATIWHVSDELWAMIAPLLRELDPPKATGRPRVEARATLDAIIFRLLVRRLANSTPSTTANYNCHRRHSNDAAARSPS